MTLPTSLNIEVDIEVDIDCEDELSDYICDYLGEEYGYCVYGFRMSVSDGIASVSEIEWDIS